jgi:hypothetical protein
MRFEDLKMNQLFEHQNKDLLKIYGICFIIKN